MSLFAQLDCIHATLQSNEERRAEEVLWAAAETEREGTSGNLVKPDPIQLGVSAVR